MSRRTSVPVDQYEELLNLVRNTLRMQTQTEVMEAIGLTNSAPGAWKKSGKVPFYVICALKGLLAEHSPDEGAPRVSVGMRFTNDQLELLNLATAEFAHNHPNSDARKLRSAILLELAARLDGGK